MVDINYLDSPDFTQDQKQEIEKGIVEGLDVSVYADPRYLAIQMLQIRTGLEEHLPVERYASPDYDWFQMDEIRKGLKSGVDIDKYASPDIPFDVMRQIREGLEEGIDLSKAKSFNAGALKELRIATLEKIDITPYIWQGYDEEQLEQIRIALENKIDIDPYISVDKRGAVIREIALGLAENLDVSCYADEKMNWRQMRQVRIGLEKRLDVTAYRNPLYSWQQMREIRLGLENNLDISQYNSFLYTASEMERRRLKLMDEAVQTAEEEKTEYKDFVLIVNADEMEAHIVVSEVGIKIQKEYLLNALHNQNIVYGIDEAMLDEIEKHGAANEILKIAQGTPATAGNDGWYEYLFDPEIKAIPAVLADGSVDYQHVKWFEMVKAGQTVAYYHPAELGEDGTRVTGEIIPGVRGKEKPAIKGTNLKYNAAEFAYVAAVDGKIDAKDGRIDISEVLILDDVTRATGNVYFNGSIYVRGTIGDGVEVKAAKDILVDGFTESAALDAGGNIVLRKGNNAGGRGYIRAGGDVVGRFFENTRVTAGGCIKADYCLKCIIRAEESIEIMNPNGMLAGGMIFAGERIECYGLGNSANLATRVTVGRKKEQEAEQAKLEQRLKEIDKELQLLQNAYTDFQRKFAPEERNNNPMYIKLESAIYTKENEKKEVMEAQTDLEAKMQRNKIAKVIANGTVYEGVLVSVNGAQWRSKRISNITLKDSDGKIFIYRNY